MQTKDLEDLVRPYSGQGVSIRWIDDTSVAAVFRTPALGNGSSDHFIYLLLFGIFLALLLLSLCTSFAELVVCVIFFSAASFGWDSRSTVQGAQVHRSWCRSWWIFNFVVCNRWVCNLETQIVLWEMWIVDILNVFFTCPNGFFPSMQIWSHQRQGRLPQHEWRSA